MLCLPDELIIRCLQFFEPLDLKRSIITCKFIYRIEKNRNVWVRHYLDKTCVGNIKLNGVDEMNFHLLYDCAWPICEVLSSYDYEVICEDKYVSFLGSVGEGYRSVQSVIAFPTLYSSYSNEANLLDYFFQLLYSMIQNKKQPNVGLFSCPYLDSFNVKKYVLEPRHVAYYEVSITDEKTRQSGRNSTSADCVAIGLAKKVFWTQKRLPGWDDDSFGYHSDDGAIFHGQGHSLATYGPTFGANDTVGCGIDYKKHSIFFTLNGKYLGEAFHDVKEDLKLYPTVGIDTNAKIFFNFGLKPFLFPLSEYMNC